ncbi:co-chaperone GroES [Candidatus Saccharibacteria bacterium]|nr:co-chaperone GroES [Candidatus Saccharibacteria bacterium]
MAIKPLKDKVVAIKEAPIKKTSSGILLGEAKETPAYATVEAVGPEVKGIKKGDKIIFKEFSTTAIKIDDKDYIIVAEEDILATL